MSMAGDQVEQAEVGAVARRYARKGYRVVRPGPGQPPPAFLGDFVPDLIAERDEDRVIVEVKRSDLVRGANELAAVAARVAREPGWRFELIALPATGASRRRRRQGVVTDFCRQAEDYLGLGLSGPALILAANAVEEAVLAIAEGQDRLAAEKSPARLARDLVTLGLIDAEDAQLAADARRLVEREAHGSGVGDDAAGEARRLLSLARRLAAGD